MEINYCLNKYASLGHISVICSLGISFNSKLSYKQHVDSIIAKTMKMMGFVKMFTSDFHSMLALQTLYMVLICPILAYGLIIWSPYYGNEITQVEWVQNRFLGYLAFKVHQPTQLDNHNYSTSVAYIIISILESLSRAHNLYFLHQLTSSTINCYRLCETFPFLHQLTIYSLFL